MPAQSSQSINDGATIPVAHVFAPMGALDKAGETVARYINRAASTLTGGAEQLISYFRSKKDGALSYRMAIILPITESVSGVNAVTRTLRGTVTLEVPANSTLQNRKDVLALVANGLASSTNFGTAVTNGEGVW